MILLWRTIGIVTAGLAVLGTVLPIMPTVPFLIVAAYAFDRSSPRFHKMIMSHPIFGPQVRDWREHGAISRRVKILAVGGMAVGLCISFFILNPKLWLAQVVILALVSVYILTRPAPPAQV